MFFKTTARQILTTFPARFNPLKEKLSPHEAEKFSEELKVKLRNGIKPNNDKKNIRKMVAGLGDSRGLIRRTFSEALGKVGPSATPALRRALLDSDDVIVRRAAAKTLKLVGDPSALHDLLKALLTDEDPVVQGSSAGAMAIFGEKAIELLEKVLLDPTSNAMQRGLASWGFSFVGAEAPLALKKAAKSLNVEVRAAAIAALGDQIQINGDQEAKGILINSINDPSSKVRAEATTLLGLLGESAWVEPYLFEKLLDKEPSVRTKAAISLMKFNSNHSLNHLNEAKSLEKDKGVRKVLEQVIDFLSNRK